MSNRGTINISSINTDKFYISQRNIESVGDVYLITPKKTMFDWRRKYYHLRSVMTDLNGNILCSGFPKFKNYGEDPASDKEVERIISSGNVVVPEKLDGSLIIRTVINGVVNIRTRGSHTVSEEFSGVMSLVKEKHSILLDNSFNPESTLLFEFCSPQNKIVVDYEEPQLILLGEMIYSKNNMPSFSGDINKLSALASNIGCKMPKLYSMPSNLSDIISEVKTWKGVEGVVVWAKRKDGSYILTKIKSEDYLAIHRLKFNFTKRNAFLIFYLKSITDINSLKDHLYNIGLDWEVVSEAESYLNEYLNAVNSVKQRISEISYQISRDLSLDRASFAKKYSKIMSSEDFSLAINIFLNEVEYLDIVPYARALDISPKNFANTINLKKSEVSKFV